jgi:hypothetical protein
MSKIFGEARQLGYVVRDIESAMAHWTTALGVGPFFYFEKVGLRDYRYRGQPQPVELSIAIANSGDMQIELIQQRNDVPSGYLDHLKQYGECLHHISSWTTDFDGDLARILAAGHSILQDGRIGRNRLAYFDSAGSYPSTIFELYDVSGNAGRLNDEVRDAAKCWDGSTPIRRL